MSKKIIVFMLLSSLTHTSFTQNWGTAAIIGALVGATSAGGCAYCMRKVKEIHNLLKTEELSPKEFKEFIHAREQQKLLAWSFGILGCTSLACTIFCFYKWYTRPTLLEQHNITDRDIEAIHHLKHILGTDQPPTSDELATMLANQQYRNFLQQIPGSIKRKSAEKTIQLLKYSYIAQKCEFPNNYQSTYFQLAFDARRSRRGRYGPAEVSMHNRINSFDATRLARERPPGIMQNKLNENDRRRSHATTMLNQLDDLPANETIKTILNGTDANQFFGRHFSLEERAKMIEIGRNLAQVYIQLYHPERSENRFF